MSGRIGGTSLARVYQHFVFGAIGGLTGWYSASLSSVFAGDAKGIIQARGFGEYAVYGACLGALIGLGSGAFDGVAARSSARVVKFGGISAAGGLIAGAVALPLLQMFYETRATANSEPAILVGLICWVLLGACVGLAEGLVKGAQPWKTIVGGSVGGLLGGTIFEFLGRPNAESPMLLAVSVATLGGFIAASVALIATLLVDASVVIEDGKLQGTEVNVSKYVHRDLGSRRPGVIGSSQWEANVYLPGDAGVLPKHAVLGYQDGAPTLSVLPEAAQAKAVTLVNGRPISSWPLSNGDRLTIGNTTLTYRQHHRRHERA